MLFGAAALIVGSLFVATVGTLARQDAQAMPAEQIVAAYDIRFLDQSDGGMTVTLADGAVLARMNTEESGFARGLLRGLGRGRKLSGVAEDLPYRLVRTRNGRLLLEDGFPGDAVVCRLPQSSRAKASIHVARIFGIHLHYIGAC